MASIGLPVAPADMLEVGNDGLTIAEQRTHFALWAMAKSPLLIGSDVRSINASSLAILKNKDLIAVSQVSRSPFPRAGCVFLFAISIIIRMQVLTCTEC